MRKIETKKFLLKSNFPVLSTLLIIITFIDIKAFRNYSNNTILNSKKNIKCTKIYNC
jgi:hypothetical protein